MKRQYKNIIMYLLSFLIPFTMLVGYIYMRADNFSDLLLSDSNEQYVYLFKYLKDIFNGDNSIFYSFSKGLGGPMFGTFCYYLSSPLNIFVIFVKDSMIPDFIGFLSVIKISLSGLTMYYALNKSNNNNKLINLSFSLAYGLMTYNIIYYFNIMWLDVVYLTPLIILGLEKIIENKKSKSYIFLLSLAIISNYYMSYMLCIFILIYFIYKIYVKYDLKKDRKLIFEITKKFIISSLLSALMTSFILIPIINELGNNYREFLFYNQTGIDGLMNVLAQIGFNIQTTKVLYTIPYFFCGFITYFVIINWFLNSDKKKEKKSFILVLTFMLASLLFKFLILFWHGGSSPILFCFRWTFLLDFFLIKTAADKFGDIKKIDRKKTFIAVGILFVLMTIGLINGDIVKNYYILFLNLIFMIMTVMLLDIVIKYKNNLYKIALLILSILQAFIVIKTNFVTTNNIKNKEATNTYLDEINILQSELEKIDDNYRVSGNDVYKKNELFGSKVGRISHFLSSADGNMVKFLQESGYKAFSSDITDSNEQLYLNKLLGIKYYYNIDCSDELVFKESIKIKNRKINICHDQDSLSLAYMIKNKKSSNKYTNAFEYQDNFLDLIAGIKVYEKLKLKKIKKNEYLIYNPYYDDIYLEYPDDTYFADKIRFNDKLIGGKKFGYVKINNDKSEIIVKVDDENLLDNIVFYRADVNKLKEAYNWISKRQAIIKQMNKNKMQLHINNDSIYNTLMITIPYNKNFIIKVDGEKVSYKKIYETFIGLELNNGEHDIELTYIPKDFYLGLFISIVGLIFTGYYLIIRKDSVNECINV